MDLGRTTALDQFFINNVNNGTDRLFQRVINDAIIALFGKIQLERSALQPFGDLFLRRATSRPQSLFQIGKTRWRDEDQNHTIRKCLFKLTRAHNLNISNEYPLVIKCTLGLLARRSVELTRVNFLVLDEGTLLSQFTKFVECDEKML